MWIENGRLTFPVEEVTIAGNLLAMFAGIEAIGSDLAFRFSSVRRRPSRSPR